MDEQLSARIGALEQKIDAIYLSTERTRKYFFGLLVATAVTFILPLFGLIFLIPSFVTTYTSVHSTILE